MSNAFIRGRLTNSFKEHRHPTLAELDMLWPDGPLQLITCNGHNATYNSRALALLGIRGPEDAVRFNPGDVCVKDGKLTGELRGHTHFKLWGMVGYSEEDQKKAALKSLAQCLSHGITSVGDMGECGPVSYRLMQTMCKSGEFPVRVYMAIHSIFGREYSARENDCWMKLGFVTGLGDEHFRVGPCKFMIDGGSGGPTCYTREPYSHDPQLKYEKGWDLEESVRYMKEIDDHGCQCTAHAMGDGAIEYMVKGYENAFAQCADKEAFKARRHRIEHCMLVDQDLIDRMAAMNICPSVNAGLQIRNGKNLARFYGPEREKYLGALKSMLEAGIVCSLHSDAPSGPVGFEMIAGAVMRYLEEQGIGIPVEKSIVPLVCQADIFDLSVGDEKARPDGYAMAIVPVHTSMDGDSIYALSLGDVPANPDTVGVMASYVMAEAIINAVKAAETAYGMPAMRDVPPLYPNTDLGIEEKFRDFPFGKFRTVL